MNSQSASQWRLWLRAVTLIISLLCTPYLFLLGVAGFVLPPVLRSALSAFFSVGLAVFSASLGSPTFLHRRMWVAVVMLVLWIVALMLWHPYTLSLREPLLSVFLAALGVWRHSLVDTQGSKNREAATVGGSLRGGVCRAHGRHLC
jgi:hypothetical protein